MTELEGQGTTQPTDLLTAVGGLTSDRSGVDTFARYLWQAKQAVRQWLTCLSVDTGPSFVVCEQVEDILLVYPDRIRFVQLKTRDRGSWSANVMCDRGIDALVRSYTVARNAGLHTVACFELWLEGPISDAADTVTFVGEPVRASKKLKDKIVSVGAKQNWLNDFLARLVIRPDQPTRAHIDAKVLWEMGALWPSLSTPEMEQIYERLLTAVTAAQGAQPIPAMIERHLATALRSFRSKPSVIDESGDDGLNAIRTQVLSRDTLFMLTPPLPSEPVEQLLGRISAGTTASMLELKMMASGASPGSIQRAQEMRADMDVERQLLMASRETAEVDLERLADRVLVVANAYASKIALSAAANPAAAARPAEALAAELLSRPGDLGQLDRAHLFGGDGLTVYGYLGHLSDQCRFPWRAA